MGGLKKSNSVEENKMNQGDFLPTPGPITCPRNNHY